MTSENPFSSFLQLHPESVLLTFRFVTHIIALVLLMSERSVARPGAPLLLFLKSVYSTLYSDIAMITRDHPSEQGYL